MGNNNGVAWSVRQIDSLSVGEIRQGFVFVVEELFFVGHSLAAVGQLGALGGTVVRVVRGVPVLLGAHRVAQQTHFVRVRLAGLAVVPDGAAGHRCMVRLFVLRHDVVVAVRRGLLVGNAVARCTADHLTDRKVV